MTITFPEGAENYYNVIKARELIEKHIQNPECEIWRCVLCGFPVFLMAKADKSNKDIIMATGCGGCGQTCMRPINEYGDK